MSDGDRIRVVGGPWPERIGCVGSIATPTPKRATRYPFAGRHKDDVIIHLDDDPLTRSTPNPFNDERDLWTCAIGRSDIVIGEPLVVRTDETWASLRPDGPIKIAIRDTEPWPQTDGEPIRMVAGRDNTDGPVSP
jgi:hypothetical protein